MLYSPSTIMGMAFKDLQQFVEDYKGPKICPSLLGGGTLILCLSLVPGSSQVLHGSIQAYSTELQNAVGGQELTMPAVSKERYYACFPPSLNDCDSVHIGCTAAVATNRYRKGSEHALICCQKNNQDFWIHLFFEKWTEEEYVGSSEEKRLMRRLFQEFLILQVMLSMLQSKAGIQLESIENRLLSCTGQEPAESLSDIGVHSLSLEL